MPQLDSTVAVTTSAVGTVHAQPTRRLAHARPKSHQLTLVDRSYSAYKTARGRPSQIPPTAVGGSFILSLTASSKRLRVSSFANEEKEGEGARAFLVGWV
jgi:hypothetical protein